MNSSAWWLFNKRFSFLSLRHLGINLIVQWVFLLEQLPWQQLNTTARTSNNSQYNFCCLKNNCKFWRRKYVKQTYLLGFFFLTVCDWSVLCLDENFSVEFSSVQNMTTGLGFHGSVESNEAWQFVWRMTRINISRQRRMRGFGYAQDSTLQLNRSLCIVG